MISGVVTGNGSMPLTLNLMDLRSAQPFQAGCWIAQIATQKQGATTKECWEDVGTQGDFLAVSWAFCQPVSAWPTWTRWGGKGGPVCRLALL